MARRRAAACSGRTPRSRWFHSHCSPRRACSTVSSGSVPNSMAMAVTSACGHSSSTALHIRPESAAETESPCPRRLMGVAPAPPHHAWARAKAASSSARPAKPRSHAPCLPRPVCRSIQPMRRARAPSRRRMRRSAWLLQAGAVPPKNRPSACSYCPPETACCSVRRPLRRISPAIASRLPQPGGHRAGSSSGCSAAYAGLRGSGREKSWKLRLRSTFSCVARRVCEKPNGLMACTCTSATPDAWSAARKPASRSSATCTPEPQ